jgi:hypothetical protein
VVGCGASKLLSTTVLTEQDKAIRTVVAVRTIGSDRSGCAAWSTSPFSLDMENQPHPGVVEDRVDSD